MLFFPLSLTQDPQLSYKNLGAKDHSDQRIQGLSIKVDGSFLRKFPAYEHELIQQSHAEETKKKRKGIALKVNSSMEDYKEISSDDEDAENFNLMVKKFGKFLKRSNDKKFFKPSKKIESNNNIFTCFKFGKQGHIKSKCLIYL